PEVARLRSLVHKRLMDEPRIKAGEAALERMLLTLASGGFVTLDPPPPQPQPPSADGTPPPPPPAYSPVLAAPTAELAQLLVFRSIHPLYGAFLLTQLGIADRNERLQALESVLELPRPLLRHVRPPWPEDLLPGPLQTTRLDPDLIQRGLILAPVPPEEDEEEDDDDWKEFPPSLSDKLRLLFDALFPDVTDVHTKS